MFPIIQPIISGLYSQYLYSYAPYFNILLIGASIYLMVVICKKYNKHLVGFGIYFLLIHSLVYELTPMIISEVTFTFFTILSIYLIFTNTYKKGYISAIVYGLSVLTRPIGIVLLPIFLYI